MSNSFIGQFTATRILTALAVILTVGGLIYALYSKTEIGLGKGFVGGNGRLEATETDIAAKLPGRIVDILVEEGDFMQEGQVLAVMQTDVLTAQLNEAKAQLQVVGSNEVKARSQITLRQSDKLVAQANLAQRKSELDTTERRLARSTVLVQDGTMTRQEFDDDETREHGAKAAVRSAEAQIAVADAAIEFAEAEAKGALSSIKVAEATVARIQADIDDSRLTAPRAGRVQYRIAQPGEVLAAGGKLLNMIDLSDVYMTFFLPETVAGKVAMGTEVRLVLDTMPDRAIPAFVSYIASTAQFTPKTVETKSERQKLMFRVKARIDKDLLLKHLTYVNTGLPGMAWIKLDPNAKWSAAMAVEASTFEPLLEKR
jgi:HlyD family secretion protein